jgi:acetyl esterase/lipase
VPAGPATTTVILVHGGGGYEGDRSQTDPWRDVHLAEGRATFSIDYALLGPATAGDGPLWPVPEQNLKAAVQFVRRDTTLPNDSVVVHGFSAGARLAGIAATTAGDPRFAGAELWPDTSDVVDVAVLFYGYHDGSQFFSDRYYGRDDPAVGAAVDHVDRTDAPLLLVHGTADRMIPAEQSVTLAAAATEAGVTVELVLVDGEGHGFDGYGTSALTAAGRELLGDIDAHLAAVSTRRESVARVASTAAGASGSAPATRSQSPSRTVEAEERNWL